MDDPKQNIEPELDLADEEEDETTLPDASEEAADPEQFGTGALNRLYPAKAGWVFLAIETQAEWEAAMATAGGADLLADPRFARPADRAEHDEALAALPGNLLPTRYAG